MLHVLKSTALSVLASQHRDTSEAPCASFCCVFRIMWVKQLSVRPSPVDGICVVSSFHFLTPTVKTAVSIRGRSSHIEVLLFLSKDSGEGSVPQEAHMCVSSMAVPLTAPHTVRAADPACALSSALISFGRLSSCSVILDVWWCISLWKLLCFRDDLYIFCSTCDT